MIKKVLLIGNGTHDFERTILDALHPLEVTHLHADHGGLLYKRGMPVELETHIPHIHVAIVLPHHDSHRDISGLLRQHGVPTLSHGFSFHELFFDRDKLNQIIASHGLLAPYHFRVRREDIAPDLLRTLVGKVHLPARIIPYGEEVKCEYFANTFEALHKAIEDLGRDSAVIDVVKAVEGEKISFFALPRLRNHEVYVTLPGVHSGNGFVLATHVSPERRNKLEKVIRDIYHVFSPTRAVRVDMVGDYVTSCRPISPLRPQPTMLEALKFAGVTTREYYKHLLEELVK